MTKMLPLTLLLALLAMLGMLGCDRPKPPSKQDAEPHEGERSIAPGTRGLTTRRPSASVMGKPVQV
jgi:hypothetical protein